jgi:hypothetical protein
LALCLTERNRQRAPPREWAHSSFQGCKRGYQPEPTRASGHRMAQCLGLVGRLSPRANGSAKLAGFGRQQRRPNSTQVDPTTTSSRTSSGRPRERRGDPRLLGAVHRPVGPRSTPRLWCRPAIRGSLAQRRPANSGGAPVKAGDRRQCAQCPLALRAWTALRRGARRPAVCARNCRWQALRLRPTATAGARSAMPAPTGSPCGRDCHPSQRLARPGRPERRVA